jgi:hypothetical protein
MPAKWIEPGRFEGVPDVRTPELAVAPSFSRGAPVVATVGLVDECGADPLLIYGFALADSQTNPGYSAANSPTVITGRQNTCSVALANQKTEFMAILVNGNDTVVAPVAADKLAQYGLTKYNGVWYVDQSKVGVDARVVITGIDTLNNRVLFKVLPAYQQAA